MIDVGNLRIVTNVAAMAGHRQLLDTMHALNKNIERMTTGLRINRAADDAAGLAISKTMHTRAEGMAQAIRNTQDAISYLHTAEGGMQQIDEKLQRLRTLAVQAATETYTEADRTKIQMEVDQLVDEINRIASATEFNDIQPLTGQVLDIHVGAGEDETLTITVTSVTVTALGISGLTVTGASNTNAENAITSLDAAMSIKLHEESLLGAQENRLENVVATVGIMMENESAAMSRIRDLDFAAEMMSMTRNQILQQTGMAMLTQANALPQAVLGLI
jgi:flagellin